MYQSQGDVKGTRLDHLNYPEVIESHLSVKVLFCPLPPTLLGQTPGHLNYCSTEKNRGLQIPVSRVQNRAFSNHVTAAILVFKAAMLVFRTNPVVVELSSHVNVFFCNHKLTQMLVIHSIVPKPLISGQSLQRSWAAANRFIRQFFKKSIFFF